MFWVVQENLYSEAGHEALQDALERGAIPHVFVKFVPFTHTLVPAGTDLSAYDDILDAPEPAIDATGEVVVCGSTLLSVIAKERGWTPGSFINDDFHYSQWREHWGDNILNSIAEVGELASLDPPWAKIFIRPCRDTKAFTGLVVRQGDFKAWRHDLLSQGRDPEWLGSATQVVASPFREILAEYRIFVVDGKIVAASMYKLGHRVVYDAYVPPFVMDFCRDMVGLWEISRGFVMDVAETPEGPKIIEINNLNSAGFYACNVGKIVEAVEGMSFTHRPEPPHEHPAPRQSETPQAGNSEGYRRAHR
jgi:hypothetical protein